MADQDYARWQAVLSTWAATATGFRWVWENEDRASFGPTEVAGILSGPHAVREVGIDYWTAPITSPGPGEYERRPRPVAKRVLTYQARVISRSQRADRKAGRYLELARMAMRLPTTVAAFNAEDLAVANVGDIKLFDAPGPNDRMESIAAFEFTLNAVPRDTLLLEGEDVGIIETIEMTSNIVDPVGDTIPAPPNMDHEIIPPSP